MSQHSRRRRQRRRHRGFSRLAFIAASVILVSVVASAAVGVTYVLNYADAAPPLNALRPFVPGPNSQVFAADGTPLGFIRSEVLRTPVVASQIPNNLRNATVAIEDQRFYQHGGVDLQGILRSAITDAVSGKPSQGASTIAMQLVRNVFLPVDQRSARTLKRKIIEVVEADRLEKKYGRDYILNRYLNSVPYGTSGGQSAIGVQAAARIFFNKTTAQLSLAQCALLAGLPQAPSDYDPFVHRAAATARRDEVLRKMLQLRYITAAQEAAAIATPVVLHPSSYYIQHRENFFFDYVTQQLVDTYGITTVQQGGLRVYTTINLHMQNLAKKAIATELGLPGDPAAAVVTEDPRTGYIETMAESQRYDKSQYNLASQGHRQPGSTFKAIVLAEALERGIDPNSTYYTSHTLSPGWLPGYPTYEVKTFEGTSSNKSINLVQATLASDNTVYAQLAADLGEQSITQMARRLGLTSPLHSYPAEALGGLTDGVSPLEMANVYATLADGGLRNRPISISRVVFPSGKVDRHWGKPNRVRVISAGVAAEEASILQQNVQSGTAVRSAVSCPTAAKTGTTSDLIDAWLDGYTPDYSTVVWIGYPTQRISMTDVHGQPQQGGYIPAQIWHDYMAPVIGNKCVPFPSPGQAVSYQPFSGGFQSGGGGSSGGSGSGNGNGAGSGAGNANNNPGGAGGSSAGSGSTPGQAGTGGHSQPPSPKSAPAPRPGHGGPGPATGGSGAGGGAAAPHP